MSSDSVSPCKYQYQAETIEGCCYRETWDGYPGERCIWHAEVEGAEKPRDQLEQQRETAANRELNRGPDDNHYLEWLPGADLSGANLRGADFSGANLRGADLSGAYLVDADLSRAFLVDADLSGATLVGADLSGADLAGADLSGADLRGADFLDATFTQSSTCGRQVRAERNTTTPEEWDRIARAYHTLKVQLSDRGLAGKARRQYLEERRARRLEAKADGDNMAWALSWCSRVLTGYGVDLKAVVGVMLVIFVIPTVVYWNAGFAHFISYSVVTFVTAPPPIPAITDEVTRGVAMAQTFLGTLSTVLLGYVLATRESI